MLPPRAQLLAQGASRLALLLTAWNGPRRQRRKVRRRVLHPLPRLVPAMFSCPRHQAVCRIGAVLVPTGPLGFSAGFCQRQGYGRSRDSLVGDNLRKRLPGSVAPSRLPRLPPGRFAGAIHPPPATRPARGGGTLPPAPPTDIPRDSACDATLGDSELATAPATPQQATE